MGVERVAFSMKDQPVPTDCCSCPIRDRAVCALCDGEELSKLDAIKSYKTYAPGQEIVGAGEPWPYVASVVTGVVKLSKTLSDGRRQMVGLLFASDFLGRAANRPDTCDAIAATETTLCRFRREPFEALMKKTPHLEQRLLQITQDELDAARAQMLLLGRKTAKERVASFLLTLLRRSAPAAFTGQARIATIPLSRDDISDYLGLTIETVSRRMTELKKEGLIELVDARTFRVLDLQALEDAAQENYSE
ncbi:MAG: helix-turn-helix domain-containing protein [Neomegalonema sp.]|nr:helix-turn-helix domain-containing protein [Neomegalonema sp.]